MDPLNAGRDGIAGQLLIGKAGARVFSGGNLAFEQFAQQLYRLRRALQGKADIGCHLTHVVILRIFGQDLQILVQSFARLALLQELFGALYAPGDLGSVDSLRRVWHERHG